MGPGPDSRTKIGTQILRIDRDPRVQKVIFGSKVEKKLCQKHVIFWFSDSSWSADIEYTKYKPPTPKTHRDLDKRSYQRCVKSWTERSGHIPSLADLSIWWYKSCYKKIQKKKQSCLGHKKKNKILSKTNFLILCNCTVWRQRVQLYSLVTKKNKKFS